MSATVIRTTRLAPRVGRTAGAVAVTVPAAIVLLVVYYAVGGPFGTLNDLSAMRAAAVRLGMSPGSIEPLVPVDVVVDHSVEIDVFNTPDAVQRKALLRRAGTYGSRWAPALQRTTNVLRRVRGTIPSRNASRPSRLRDR